VQKTIQGMSRHSSSFWQNHSVSDRQRHCLWQHLSASRQQVLSESQRHVRELPRRSIFLIYVLNSHCGCQSGAQILSDRTILSATVRNIFSDNNCQQVIRKSSASHRDVSASCRRALQLKHDWPLALPPRGLFPLTTNWVGHRCASMQEHIGCHLVSLAQEAKAASSAFLNLPHFLWHSKKARANLHSRGYQMLAWTSFGSKFFRTGQIVLLIFGSFPGQRPWSAACAVVWLFQNAKQLF